MALNDMIERKRYYLDQAREYERAANAWGERGARRVSALYRRRAVRMRVLAARLSAKIEAL